MALNKSEVRRLEKTKAYARPVFMYVATGCLALIVGTICYLLIMRYANLAETTALVMAIFTGILAPITTMIAGRSWEKTRGKASYPHEHIDDEEEVND